METALSSQQLVRLLADDARRKIVAALVLDGHGQSATELAERSGLTLRAVVDGADRLVSGGLVEEIAGSYTLIDQVFQQAARAEVEPRRPSDHGDQPPDVARVLDAAFKDGKLVQWPAKRSKRLIVLDFLAQQFDIGRRYTEAQVNAQLRDINSDVATTRRYLVDEEFLDRGAGEYWRCGGSI